MDARSGRPRLAAIAFALLLLPGLVYGSSAAFSSGSVPAPSLTVEVAGATDLGRVTSDPPGIDCGSDCDEEYGATTTVELTAEAQGDATFEGWSGNPDCSTANPCTVQVDEEESVTATFSAPARRITVTKTGTGQGTVTSTPGGINCGATCFADFPHDPSAQVTLFASPADGSAFEGWSGGGCAGTSTCVLRPTQDLSVTANFGPASFGSQPIVFSAQREGVHGHYEIWKMNGDGSSEVQLTRTSPGLTNYLPVLSADGTTIAFVRTDTDGNGSQIFLMDADGTNERQLTSDPPDSDVDYGQGSFSPDGRSFVVGGNVRPRTSGGLCRSLAIVEIPSGDTTNLVEECVGGSLSYGDPVFTPDGESIVYRREFEDTGELSIFKMDVETRDETEVFRPPATATAGDGAIEPAVSPDGSLIAFRLFGSDVVEGNTRFINQIFVVGSDGSGARPLTSRDETALHPAFSPAGDRIVFETVRNPGGSGFLESSDLSGDDRVDLTGPDQPIMSPHWGTASAGVCAVDDTRAKNQDGYYTGAGDPPNMAKKPLARGLAPPRIEKVAPRASIAGASVTLRGDGLDGKRLHARVDGRRAKLFERRGASVTLGLPAGLDEGRQRVEVRRGRHRAAGSVRIRESFDGELDAELDSANATTGSIGPAGGTLAATGADGTSFTLEVPAGALATTEQVTMTPVSRLVDSPFSGASEGVDLAPDGLAFTTPATLTIRRPGGFPPNTTGFAMGESLEIKRPSGTRRSLVLELDHFSTHGAGGLTEQDAVDTISGYLEDRKGRDLTRSEIRSLLTMIGIFEGPEYFPFPLGTIIDGNVAVLPDEPASFCARNAVCDEAQAIAQTSIRNLAKSACDRGKANPSAAGLAVLTEINNLSAEFQQLGGEGDGLLQEGCAADIGARLNTQLVAAIQRDPLARGSLPALPKDPRTGRPMTVDLNGDGLTSSFESARLHASAFQLLGFEGLEALAAELLSELEIALAKILGDNLEICRNSQSRDSEAAARLREGHAYALNLAPQQVNAFLSALGECGVAVLIRPGSARLRFGKQQQFIAELTSTDAEVPDRGIKFEVVGDGNGAITPEGLYTAPSKEGIFQVRARSNANPARFDSANVVVTAGC